LSAPSLLPSPAIVLDTSSLVAILNAEADAELYAVAIATATTLYLSAVSRVELGIVTKNRGLDSQLDKLLAEMPVQITPFDEAQSQLAIAAFTQYGKGRHKADLNFGDCCAYALAKSLGLPLLYKGGDFAATDIGNALA
jgi:ribonuclease VapC